MHPADNVAIVVTAGGLKLGDRVRKALSQDNLVLLSAVPQGHKVALSAIAAGQAVIRYNVKIGNAKVDIPAGSWVHERLLDIPAARDFQNLTMATAPQVPLEPLTGYTFEGYRNSDGSVGTRNFLAVTTTVQCVAGVVALAVQKIKEELLPLYPHVDDVVGIEHTYGCGVAIDAPDAVIPIRTLRNISLNPNFGNEVFVISLGCEKLPPQRLLPPGSFHWLTNEQRLTALTPYVCKTSSMWASCPCCSTLWKVPSHTWRASMPDAVRRCLPASWWWVCNAVAAMLSLA